MYNRTLLIAGVMLCMLISLITPLCVTPSDIPSVEQNKTNNSVTDNRADPGSGNNTPVNGTGTVKYQDIEGGFYGIISDNGEKYLPDNLPPAYSSDGTRVQFTVLPLNDTVSIMMWGQPVTILSITALSPAFSGQMPDISGVQWNLTKYQRYGRLISPISNGTEITLMITDNTKISGSSGCGQYNGSVSVTNSSMILRNITLSPENCADKTNQDQQNQFLDLLSSVRSYMVDKDILQMADATNKTILTFGQ